MTAVKNLLPIGSVVKLKNSSKNVTIIGILVDNDGVKFDYISVLFPEGYIDAKSMFVFNHEDIEKVEFIGYINAQFQMFRGRLSDELDK